MTINQEERLLLAQLADELIPAGDGMPAASAAGVAGQWLDAVLAARPDLTDPLKSLLEKAHDYPAAAASVNHFRSHDLEAFGVLAEITAAAYFMNPEVQRAVGYTGQTPQPIDPRPDYLDEHLLEPVIRRGLIYRPTPR
jgi:hypothetical protein